MLRAKGAISQEEIQQTKSELEMSQIELSRVRDELVLSYGLTDQDLQETSANQESRRKARLSIRARVSARCRRFRYTR